MTRIYLGLGTGLAGLVELRGFRGLEGFYRV